MKLRRLALLLGVAAASGALVWGASLYSQVRRAAVTDDARAADAIVVFGAAEYRGKPSPVLRARLEHALGLYRKGLARRVITTGGAGGDPTFTEAGVARNYLVEQGLPPESILMENQSSTTTQTVLYVAELMERSRLTSCVVVSDGYHLFRIQRQLGERGIVAYGSPRPSQQEASHWMCIKQVLGYMLWKAGIRL
jgi:uncharacterized SAM-binding protein YcdF (DUF218 family)